MTVTPEGSITIQFFVDNGESYLMTGTLSEDGSTISGQNVQYLGTSGCGANDVGSSFAATLYQSVTGTYTGTLTPDGGGNSFNVTISLTQDSSFNLTGAVTTSDNPCFADLAVDSDTYPSIVSGNVVVFWGTDSQGDVIGFVGNTGGPNDDPGDTTWQQLFITAISYSGACTGQSYTDDTFHRQRRWQRRHPILVQPPPFRRWPLLRNLRDYNPRP